MGSVVPHYDIPTHCKAGVVVNEGPDFHVEVQMVPVPETGRISRGVRDVAMLL
jgi:hypothetical protein